MYAKPCCLSLVSAAHLCPLHHVPPLSGCGVLAVYIWPQHDWWLESGADSGSSPLSARSLPTHVRAPSASFLRHSCQVSQNNDYLSPETNLHSDTFPGWCLVAWGLLCRGPLPTSQSSCETSFLRVCKTCQEANIEVWERERSLYSLFLWSLLTNNYSYARCPGCTANVPTFLHGRTAELKAWGKKKKKKQGEASPLSKWPIAISEDLSVPGGHSSCSEGAAGALCLQHQCWGDSKLPNTPYIKISSSHGK